MVDTAVQAKETLRVNYHGTLGVSKAFIPMLKAGGRVVNVAMLAVAAGDAAVATNCASSILGDEKTEGSAGGATVDLWSLQ